MTRHLRPRPLRDHRRCRSSSPATTTATTWPGRWRSALDQDEVEVDVIVIDDASPDGSAAVAAELASADAEDPPGLP